MEPIHVVVFCALGVFAVIVMTLLGRKESRVEGGMVRVQRHEYVGGQLERAELRDLALDMAKILRSAAQDLDAM